MKKILLVVTTFMMMSLLISACNKQKSVESTVEHNPVDVEKTLIVPSITPTEVIIVPNKEQLKNSYFFKDSNQPVIYRGLISFGTEAVEEKVTLQIRICAELSYGKLYELKLYAVEEIPEDRLTLGYFYVQEDKIYKINPTKENLDQLKTTEELPSDSVVVCQEEEIKDALGKKDSGWHQYLEVDGDKRVYHSYNNQVSSGFYETFTWESGQGLINYRSGYGAEADSIELQLLSSTIEPTQSTTIEQNQSEDKDWVTTQNNKILQQKPEYRNCKQYSYPLGDAYVIVYEGPNVDKDDWENYYVDIWAYNENWFTQVVDNTWIVPESFQVGTIGEQDYFCFDLSYVTDSTSTLLILDEKKELHILNLPGSLYEVNGKDFTVTSSAYDMVYIKNDQYSCGHTWKPYYYYLEDYEIIEYAAVDMSEEEFKQYQGANDILDLLKEEYSSPEQVVSFSFGKRDNGLLHVNIYVESKDEIAFYYETFKIQNDRSLVSKSSGEGAYATIPMFTE